jgi:uncharacterized membrane protein
VERALVLLAVMAAAAVLRLPGLLHDGLWRDQASVYVVLSATTFGEVLRRIAQTEWHPPLFFLIDYPWVKLLGESETAFTLLPFLFALATIPVLYRLGTIVASPRVGLVAASIFAIAPLAVGYSEESLYPMTGLLAMLLTLLIAQARAAPMNPIRWTAIALVTMLTIYSHYTALLFIPLLILWSLWPSAGRPRKLDTATALLAGAVPFAAWLPVFLAQNRIGLPWRLPPPGLGEKLSYLMATLLQLMPARPERLEIAALALFVLASIALARLHRVNSGACALGALFLLMLVATTAANLTAARYVLPYYGLLCVCLARIAVATGEEIWLRSTQRRRVWLAPLATLVAAGFVVGDVQTVLKVSALPKSGIRSFVGAQPPDRRTLYLIAPDYLAPTFAFYARGTNYRGFVRWRHPEIFQIAGYANDWNEPGALEQTLRAIAAETSRYDRLDLVLDESAHDQGELPYSKVRELLQRLRERYPLLTESFYPGRLERISVYRFKLT